MRFSFWPDLNQSWSEIVSLAEHVERSGWDGFWLADHFMPNAVDVSEPCHEVFTFLSGLAAAVPRLRLGSMVASNTYRHPAVLAKMAASLDHVSAGRLVLGLGAGWQENEHHAYGLEYFTTIGRLRRLEEACQVIKALFNETRANFSGKYYQLNDAPLEPKPLQQTLPLMIGGGGEKVTLRIVARFADEWNVWGTLDTFKRKSDILERHCEAVGRDPREVQRSVAVLVGHSEDPAQLRRLREMPSDHAAVVATSAEWIDTLGAYQEAGLDELLVPDFNFPPGQAKLDAIDHFFEDVVTPFQDKC